MSEMTPDEVSLAGTLRHIADDHPCCKDSLLAAAGQIEALDKKVAAAQKYVETLLEFGDDETGHYHVGDEVALEDLRAALAAERILRKRGPLPADGVPCDHPGCLSHVTHPCEGCGRIAGRAALIREEPRKPLSDMPLSEMTAKTPPFTWAGDPTLGYVIFDNRAGRVPPLGPGDVCSMLARIEALLEHRRIFQCEKTVLRCKACDELIAALAAKEKRP
jgi:hypothetical protein